MRTDIFDFCVFSRKFTDNKFWPVREEFKITGTQILPHPLFNQFTFHNYLELRQRPLLRTQCTRSTLSTFNFSQFYFRRISTHLRFAKSADINSVINSCHRFRESFLYHSIKFGNPMFKYSTRHFFS